MEDRNTPNRLLLKRVLYRIDFQFITEKIHEDIYAFIAEKYGHFFSEQSQELANEIDMEIDISQLERPRVNKKSQPIFVFWQPKTDECDGRTLKFGRTFLYFELDLKAETMGIPYHEWVADIITQMNAHPIFRLTRVGLRKFNSFFILGKNLENLKRLFHIDYLSEVPCKGFALDSFSNEQMYEGDKYNLRFSRKYSSGLLSNVALDICNEESHEISFDFDLFTTADELLYDLREHAENMLLQMNDTIREFFTSVLDPEAVRKLNLGEQLEEYQIIPN